MINVVVKNYINLKLNKILNYDFNINFESKKNKFYKTENNLNYDILQKANEIHQILLKKIKVAEKNNLYI